LKADAKKIEKKDLWKLVMIRKIASVQIRFSDWCDCSQALYKNKEKLDEHKDGSITMHVKLCPICVSLNIANNELVGKFAEASAGQKRK
jgi:hypothetical protein